jgi:plasmid virulence protein D
MKNIEGFTKYVSDIVINSGCSAYNENNTSTSMESPSKKIYKSILEKNYGYFGATITIETLKANFPNALQLESHDNSVRLFIINDSKGEMSCIIKTDKDGCNPSLLNKKQLDIEINKQKIMEYLDRHKISSESKQDHLNECSRVENAIIVNESPEKIPNKLTKQVLADLAYKTNNTYIHYSGNCVLLATCIFYNLTERKIELTVQNTGKPWTGFNSEIVEPMLLGKRLGETLGPFKTLDEVEVAILKEYKISGKYVFVLDTSEYILPIMGRLPLGLSLEHALNVLVILDQNNEPMVQFLDAWKTSDTLPTKESLASRYTGGNFTIKCNM